MKWSMLLAPAALVCSGMVVQAQDWADVTIKFVLDGAAPAGVAVNAGADAFFAQQQIPAERLVVDSASKGIANMVFMIDAKQTKLAKDQINPYMRDVPETKPVLANVTCRFTPLILPTHPPSYPNKDTTTAMATASIPTLHHTKQHLQTHPPLTHPSPLALFPTPANQLPRPPPPPPPTTPPPPPPPHTH